MVKDADTNLSMDDNSLITGINKEDLPDLIEEKLEASEIDYELLMQFNQDMSKWSAAFIIKSYLKIMYETLRMFFTMGTSCITNMFGVVLLNMQKDSRGQAVLGMGTTFYVLFYFGIVGPFFDKVGIAVAKHFAANQPKQCRAAFSKAILVVELFLFLFIVPTFYFSDKLFELVNTPPDTAKLVQEALMVYLGAVIFKIHGDLLKTFCNSHGVEVIFSWTSSLNALFTFVHVWIFMWEFNWGVPGYYLSRLVMESINLCVAIYAFSDLKSDAKGLATWAEAMDGMGSFLWDSFKFIGGNYGQELGLHVASVMVYTIGDEAQTTAYTSFISLTIASFGIGSTVSVGFRSRVNILLGRKLNKAAKKLYFFMIASVIFSAIMVATILIGFRYQLIEWIVGSGPEVSYYFMGLTIIYAIIQIQEFSIYTTQMAIKSIGKINYMLFFNVFVLFLGNSATSYYLVRVAGYSCISVAISTYAWLILENLFLIGILIKSDWAEAVVIGGGGGH